MSGIVEFFNRKKFAPLIIVGLLFLAFVGVFCLIHYSDGDDAYFVEATSTRSYFEYLKFRYETWSGRMGGESLVYVVFRLGGIWFWRVVNAMMVVALPILLLNLSAISNGLRLFNCNCSLCCSQQNLPCMSNWEIIRLLAVLFSGFLLMDVMTFGHSAVWVNGSIFYTWSIVCGLLALMPAVKFFYGSGYRKWELAYAIPLGIIASTSIEQIGAVLFAFIVVVLLAGILQKKKLDVGLLLQAVSIIVLMVMLFFAPGNGIRTAVSYEQWLPTEFMQLGFCEHAFISYQWLISSFANEGRLFFLCIWILGCLLLLEGKEFGKHRLMWIIPASIFSLVALLPFAKIALLSNVGLDYVDPAVKLEVIPSWAAMTLMNRVALFLWTLAVAFTVPFLWNISRKSIKVLLLFAAAIASECIMFFSPTMYASGERVYYVTSLLLLLIIVHLFMNLKNEKWKNILACAIVLFGFMNALLQAAYVLQKMRGY